MIAFEPKDVLHPTAFKELVIAGGVESARVGVADKGLVIVIRIAGADRIYGQYRGGPRYFRSLDGAVSSLIQHGIYSFAADVRGWRPKTLGGLKAVNIDAASR